MTKVFLDAGHGGKDPGAVGNGLKEKDISLTVTLKIGNILSNHGIDVRYSRTTDKFVELIDRAKTANNSAANVFISIHCNAFGNSTAQGVETYSHIGSSKGAVLAKNVHDEIIKSKAFTKNRGTKTDNFLVIRETTMPAILVELAFITNVQDANILRNSQEDLALAIAKGVLKNLGIVYNGDSSIKVTQTLKRNSVGAQVRILQTILRDLGYYTGDIDSSFGPATEQAVKDFQKVNGLEIDGSVGPATRQVLNSENAKSKNTSGTSLSKVQVGAFSVKTNADNLAKKLEGKGYSPIVISAGGLYKVQVGAFSVRPNADALVIELKNKGYEAIVVKG